MEAVVQAVAGEGEEDVSPVHPVPLPGPDGGHLAGDLRRDGLLRRVGKGGASGAGTAVDGGGAGLADRQGPGVGHLHRHIADNPVALQHRVRPVNLGNGSLQRLEGALQSDGRPLANGEARRLVGKEGDRQCHNVGVAQGGHGLPGGYVVPLLYLQG